MVLGVYAIDKVLDDPVGALSAHGLAGIWGTLSCGMFTVAAPRPVQRLRRSRGRARVLGPVHPARYQALGVGVVFAFVFIVSFTTFWVIKQTYGLRVTEEEEEAGLDISEHGMYGYPEQFIPAPELVGYASAATA